MGTQEGDKKICDTSEEEKERYAGKPSQKIGVGRIWCVYKRGGEKPLPRAAECRNVTYDLGEGGRWVEMSGKYEGREERIVRVRNKFSHVIRNGPFNHKYGEKIKVGETCEVIQSWQSR